MSVDAAMVERPHRGHTDDGDDDLELEEADFGPHPASYSMTSTRHFDFAAANSTSAAASSSAYAAAAVAAAAAAASASSPAAAAGDHVAAGVSTAAQPAQSSSPLPLGRRVKMYALSQTGRWEDRGTGFFTYKNVRETLQRTVTDAEGRTITDPSEPQFGFRITQEVDPSAATPPPAEPIILMDHQLIHGTDYAMQNDTILTWCMVGESKVDVAVSFQERDHCGEAWTLLQQQLHLLNPPPLITDAQDPFGMQGDDPCDYRDMGGMAPMDTHLSVGDFGPSAHADDGHTIDIHGGGGVLGRMDDDFGLSQSELLASQAHPSQLIDTRQQRLDQLPEDNLNAPPVTIDGLELLTQRISQQQQRISKRELQELVHIWQQKDDEFHDLLQEEQREFEAEKMMNDDATEAASPSSTPPPPTAAAATVSTSSAWAPPSALPPVAALAPSSSEDLDTSTPIMICLHQLCAIFKLVKAILLTNDVEVLEILFSDSGISQLVGMLEYDPLYAQTHPVRGPTPHDFRTHRTFLARAAFQFVVPFFDEVVLHKVHQNYRVTYLKDVILSSNHLDDATIHTLTQIIFVNMVSIIARLTEKKEFIDAMFLALNAYARIDMTQIEEEHKQAVALERQKTVLLTNGDAEETTEAERTESIHNASMDSLLSDATAIQGADGEKSPHDATAVPAAATTDVSSQTPLPSMSNPDAALTPAGSPSSTPFAAAAGGGAPPVAPLKTILLFLQELVLMAKNVQAETRDAFYKALDRYSLFEVLEAILVREEEEHAKGRGGATLVEEVRPVVASTPPTIHSGGDSAHNWLWLVCTDIISNICIHDASLFRTYLISSFDAPNSILAMVFALMASPNLTTSLAHQLSCLIRLVLDPEAMSVQDQYLFLGRIYEEHLSKLLDPLRAMQPTRADENPFTHAFSHTTNPLQLMKEAQAKEQREAAQVGYHIAAYHAIELLSYCALHHNSSSGGDGSGGLLDGGGVVGGISSNSNYFRNFALKHQVLPLVMNLLRTTRRNDLVCSAIRFFRICLGSRDDFYTEIILQHDLFEPILIHFAQNGPRYNLLNSVVCEMMFFFNETHRAKEKNQPRLYNANSIRFLECLVKKYWTKYGLEKITYVGTFQESKCLVDEWESREANARQEQRQSNAAGGPKPGAASDHMECSERKSNHGVGGDGSSGRILLDDDDAEAHMYGEGGHRGSRTSLSRTIRAVLAADDDEEPDENAAAASGNVGHRRGNKFTVRTGGGKAPTSGGKHRLITKRRKTPQKQTQLLADEYYQDDPVDAQADLDRAFHAHQHASPAASSSESDGRVVGRETDSPATDDSFEEFEVTHSPTSSSGGDDSMGEIEMHSSPETTEDVGPQRRIVFVSEHAGEVQRQLLPQATGTTKRRNGSSGKRKHDAEESEYAPEDHDDDFAPLAKAPSEPVVVISPPTSSLSAAASFGAQLTSLASSPPPTTAAAVPVAGSSPSHRASSPPLPPLSPHHSLLSPSSSPPVLHGSPGKHQHAHNPYLHVPPSELPPTAQRSPELKGVCMPMPLQAGGAPSSSRPNSPPRQMNLLDLADLEDGRTEERAAHAMGSPSHAGVFAHQMVSPPSRTLSAGLMASPPPVAHHHPQSSGVHPGLSHSPPPPAGKKSLSAPLLSALQHMSSPPLAPLSTQEGDLHPPIKRRRMEASI